MKSRAIIPLLVGLGIGLFAVKSFLGVLKKARGSGSAETVAVVRAKSNIAPTVELKEGMVETAQVPKTLVPQGAFSDPKKVVGRVTSGMVPAGAPVVPALLAPEGTLPGLSSRVPEGYRAVAVQIDEIAGVAGWLKPGCRVDVGIVMGSSKNPSISKVILQNVEILAVGQTVKADGAKASVTRSVTVLVTPEDATKLHLASTKGRLRLAMRNSADFEEPRPKIVTIRDLLQDGAPKKDDEEGPSLLSRLLAKLPKIGSGETDEYAKPETPKVAIPVPVQLAAAPPNREWVVDVLSGPKSYQLRFDSDRSDARQIGGQSNRSAARSSNSGPRVDAPALGGNAADSRGTAREVGGVSAPSEDRDDMRSDDRDEAGEDLEESG